MLNQEQAREYNRFKKLGLFFTANQPVVATYSPFAEEVNEYQANLAILETFVPQKEGNTNGITTGKTELKQQIADDLATVCTTTKAYALKYNSPQLAAQMNYRASGIYGLKDADILPLVIRIGNTITPLLTDTNYQPYGITAATLTPILSLAQTFNNSIGLADNQAAVSTTADQNIDETIHILRNHITQFDLLINHFKKTNPDFVTAYHINSSVDHIGIRHSGIEGQVTAAATGQPVANATLSLSGTSKKTITDLNGQYRLIRISPGDYTLSITAPSYPTKTIIQHITSGRIDTLNIKLEA